MWKKYDDSIFFRTFLELYIFIGMGRKKIYKTEEELLEKKRQWKMDYYNRNKEELQKKNLKRYHDKKNRDI